MLISYVIPVYNMEKYIRQCINSIFFQILPIDTSIELVIVNDGSTDNSIEMICDAIEDRFCNPSFDTIVGYKILDMKNNKGAGNALYEGFKLADGDYICFLSADDVLIDVYKTWDQISHMQKQKSDLSYCNLYKSGVDINNSSIIKSSFVFKYDMFNKYILSNNYLTYFMLNFKNPINSSTFMFKRQSIDHYGTWNPDLKGDCDGDMLLRYSLYGAKITEVSCRNPVLYYRTHEGQVSNNSSLMSKSMLYNREKYRTYVLDRDNLPLWIRLMTKLFVRV